MKQQKYDIFISYRRKTGADDARLLQQALKARGYNVFFDYDSLRDGKFNERIYAAIEEAPIFILMLSEGALDNCANEDDWVRIEIEYALMHKCKIVPISINPSSWIFPKSFFEIKGVSNIANEQISELNKSTLFEESVDRIVIDRFPRELQKISKHGCADNGDKRKINGRYYIRRQCGMGEMGSVFLAEDTLLEGKMVAVKHIPSEIVSDECSFKELKEFIKLIMGVSHSNVASCRAIEIDEDGNAFLILDYIEGLSLNCYVRTRGGRLSEAEIMTIFIPIAKAIDFMHSKGLLHKDIKPNSIMISSEGVPYLVDMGQSKLMQDLLTRIKHQTFDMAGTLPYRSPESQSGYEEDVLSDVYSFAAVIYECLTGRIYGMGKEDNNKTSNQLMMKLMKGLSVNSGERPMSCSAVLKTNQDESLMSKGGVLHKLKKFLFHIKGGCICSRKVSKFS